MSAAYPPSANTLTQSQTDAQIVPVLDWLATPFGDPIAELGALSDHLRHLLATSIPVGQFHRVLDMLQGRALVASRVLKERLLEASATPGVELLRQCETGAVIHWLTAAGYVRVLADAEHRTVRNRRRNPAQVAGRMLRSLVEQLVLTNCCARPAPPGLWRSAHAMYRDAELDSAAQSDGAEAQFDPARAYRELLALGAANPDALAPAEIVAASQFVELHAAKVELAAPGEGADLRAFWCDPAGDEGPIAAVRRAPPEGLEVVVFSCAALGELAGRSATELDAGTASVPLPGWMHTALGAGLLERLRSEWRDPATRHLARRRASYLVQLRSGYADIRALFLPDAGYRPEPAFVSAQVVNESPTGYAVRLPVDETWDVFKGSALALRGGPQWPWDLCAVRWMRRDGDEMELGLQVIATHAEPVEIAFRDTKPRPPTPALLLPAAPALRSHDALLAPAGTCTSRRLIVLRGTERLRVSQARVLSVDLQTACLELFQIQPDPYPS